MTAEPVVDKPEEREEVSAAALEDLLERQLGVLSRAQALAAEISDGAIEANLDAERWQRIYPGVYATFTGTLSFEARVWAAVLYAGKGAVASHVTAACLWKIGAEDVDSPIHVTVPAGRRVRAQAGLQVHRSTRADTAAHPAASPPRTRVEDTVVDLIDDARTFEGALTVVMRAVQRHKTTTARIRLAMAGRKKLRWRRELAGPLADVAGGSQTVLELRYVRDVERAHGLPHGERQSRWRQDGRSRYTDVRLKKYRMRIELDGRIGHDEDGAFRDMERTTQACSAAR